MKVNKKTAGPLACEMFLSGRSYRQIGDHLGVTRCRAMQLARIGGLAKGAIGGRPLLKMQARALKENAEIDLHGCTVEEIRRFRKICSEEGLTDPYFAFLGQKSQAARRGIGWFFTFMQWWEFWRYSYTERGNGKLVMARFGDVGPYSPSNVKIMTSAANVGEWRANRICQ